MLRVTICGRIRACIKQRASEQQVDYLFKLRRTVCWPPFCYIFKIHYIELKLKGFLKK